MITPFKINISNKIIEDITIAEQSCNFDCFDLSRSSKSLQTKVYGIKICFQNVLKRKTLIVSAKADDMVISCMSLSYLNTKLLEIHQNKPKDPIFINKAIIIE